jgi:NADH-quinone oxidoreductase subunit M
LAHLQLILLVINWLQSGSFIWAWCFAATIVLLNNFNAGEDISVFNQWINKPKVSIALDGLSLAMLLLTTALTAVIIFTSFENVYTKKSVLCLNLVHGILLWLELLATDGLLYYIFWELALIPIYFIALIWGNGDAEERKSAIKFFIYTLAGSLFMLIAFVYLYQKGIVLNC